MKKYVKIKIFVELLPQLKKKIYILKINQYWKPDKAPCKIYADLQFLVKKIYDYKNNPKKSSTTKIGEHIPCGYSMSNIWTFDNTENRYSLYREKDCVKKFCVYLREHAADVINFGKTKV